ncbi:hypothetical protein Hgul01_03984 [Herpetosiphon gulosus]|uniref:Uncharacterized protein n=1 Tax=Herpetosiphon gulosus TaxID=1973496 RepID=A0ABP9X5P7_9CHLR
MGLAAGSCQCTAPRPHARRGGTTPAVRPFPAAVGEGARGEGTSTGC